MKITHYVMFAIDKTISKDSHYMCVKQITIALGQRIMCNL